MLGTVVLMLGNVEIDRGPKWENPAASGDVPKKNDRKDKNEIETTDAANAFFLPWRDGPVSVAVWIFRER